MRYYPFPEEEVLSFVENKIKDDTATEDEQILYQDYQWYGKLNKMSGTYRKLINQIHKINNKIY